ncbi:MAG: Eco57I restriction-modification methylase domain-containing protein, partial [Planctomycetia bacterium]
MAGMFDIPAQPELRLLDAGAGVGILSAAVCEVVANLQPPRTIYVEAWENDPKLGPRLRATLDDGQQELVRHGHQMTFDVVADDFILGRASGGLFDAAAPEPFHLAILNPPYFKLRKNSPHALTMAHV